MSQLELRRETAGGAAQSSQALMSSGLGASLRKTRNRLPHEEADVLIAAGPPFDPEEFGFHLHARRLTEECRQRKPPPLDVGLAAH